MVEFLGEKLMTKRIRVVHESIPIHRKMFNLGRFLYCNGASVLATSFDKNLKNGQIGEFIEVRTELILTFKNYLEESLFSGASVTTVSSKISYFSDFVEYCDDSEEYYFLCIENFEKAVLDYCDFLIVRALDKNDKLSKGTAYNYGKSICQIATSILLASTPLFNRTRLKKLRKNNSRKIVSKSADKVLKKQTSEFGSIIFDLMQGISIDGITGKLPLRIPVRSKLVENNELVFFGSLMPESAIKAEMSIDEYVEKYMLTCWAGRDSKETVAREYIDRFKKRFSPNTDLNQAKRFQIYNCKILAEQKMFIAMTQGNTQPVSSLKRSKFDFKPMGDFYHIREYKNRAGGNVIFEIHKLYKEHFESYLEFRDQFVALYPLENSDLLFPFFRPPTANGNNKKPVYVRKISEDSFRKNIFLKNNLPWVTNKSLRQIPLNLLHQMTGDEHLTAEQASHTVNTFKQNYEKPSLHKANIEVTKFWTERDPIKVEQIHISVLQSLCDFNPKAGSSKPSQVVEPNCINPSGCLWCEKHRDVGSFDYIWSLTSMRYLKRIEGSLLDNAEENPIDMIIDRINSKIDWFRKNPSYLDWVKEAEIRVDEEQDFHPFWLLLIQTIEGS